MLRPLCSLLVIPGLVAQTTRPSPSALTFLENARSAVLVVLAPDGHALTKAAWKALREQDLAELEVSLVVLDPLRQAKRCSETRAAVPGLPALGWGLLSAKGALIASGTESPNAPALAKALSQAGIQSPIKTLRAFLHTRPEHLEARGDLLRLLRQGAVARTMARLDLAAKEPQEGQSGNARFNPSDEAELPDLLPFAGKRLKEAEDLELWGPYAQELDRAFQDGSWRSMDLGMDLARNLPVEVCSPTLQAIYLRHLPKVEQTLSILPDSRILWQIWLRMTAVAGTHRSRAVVQGLVIPPPELRLPWPPKGVVSALVRDAQKSGDWWLVRDMLQPFWENWRDLVKQEEARGKADPKAQSGLKVDWTGTLGPLLESMIRSKAEGEAFELVGSLALFPETRPLVERAALLANVCKRPDLARRFANLRR